VRPAAASRGSSRVQWSKPATFPSSRRLVSMSPLGVLTNTQRVSHRTRQTHGRESGDADHRREQNKINPRWLRIRAEAWFTTLSLGTITSQRRINMGEPK
jgi:hypothetical protein